MKTKTTSYSHLADLCERKGHTLGLKLQGNRLTLVISRKNTKPLSTSFSLSDPGAAAKRLMEKL